MSNAHITTYNIYEFRGALIIKLGDLPFGLWDVFDRAAFDSLANGRIVSITKLVSTKNELVDPRFVAGDKPDPRFMAFERMAAAAKNSLGRREPIKATANPDGTFQVVDGNATVQVLMLVGWDEVPIEVIS